jgi:hypothetical protein
MTIKFSTQSDLELFKALQRLGKLSFKKLSKTTSMPKTTIQYAYRRIKEREFFKTKTLPILEKFPELPLALISFSYLNPLKLKILKDSFIKREEVRLLISNDSEIIMMLMDSSKDKLAESVYEIMKKAQAKPSLHILSPNIGKLDLSIPDKILDKLYTGLRGKIKKKK